MRLFKGKRPSELLWRSALTLVVVGVGLVAGFQNCAPANFGTADVQAETVFSSETPQTPDPVTTTTQPPRTTSTVPNSKPSCYLEGREIKHGETVVAYSTRTYVCGSQPDSEVRACDNGFLSGSYPYVGMPAVTGSRRCPAQTLRADITNGNGAYCVQSVPESETNASQPVSWRFADHGPNCKIPPNETFYLGTAYYPPSADGFNQVCENWCAVVATCGCDGVWKVNSGTW